MNIYGLIGYPLSHSGSALWFEKKFRDEGRHGSRYLNFPISSLDEFPRLFRKHPGLNGLNVTIPYKVQIIPWLEELDEKAEEIGAVNTIYIYRERGNVHLKGFNTDADAFQQSADFSGYRKALILGTGGAAKAVAYALAKMGISFLFVSRLMKSTTHISYADLTEELFSNHQLIINATPLGMFPLQDTFPPIPFPFLTKNHFLYDLVYNPGMTVFLKNGTAAGTKVQNGLRMLEIQAELSYHVWNNSH